MNEAPKALLLVGSPKGHNSTSYSLGIYLLDQLAARGCSADSLRIHPSQEAEGRQATLLAAVAAADLVILSCPLYVDSPPAPVIQAMELIAAHRRSHPPRAKQRLLAISNCGFPETHHNDTALAIYRQFAREAGFVWAGGLALGGGEVIDDRPLVQVGGLVRHLQQALVLTADALVRGEPVPPRAVALMARPLVPRWLYVLMGNWNWRRQAGRAGGHDLKRRPYAQGRDTA